jgi:hypothetical protein
MRSTRRLALRGSAAPVILPEKSIFNLRVDAMEPLLGPLGSVLISSDLRFQLRNPVFGCP